MEYFDVHLGCRRTILVLTLVALVAGFVTGALAHAAGFFGS